MVKAWKVVVFLFCLVACLYGCPAQAADKKTSQRPTDSFEKSGVVDHSLYHAVNMQLNLKTCMLGAHDVPCCEVFMTYDDGETDGGRVLAFGVDGSWKHFLSNCGDAIDELVKEWKKVRKR